MANVPEVAEKIANENRNFFFLRLSASSAGNLSLRSFAFASLLSVKCIPKKDFFPLKF